MEIGVKGSRCFSMRSGAFTPFTPTVSAYLPLISPIYMFSRAFFSRAVCVRPQKRGSLMRFYRFGTMKNRTRPFVRPRVPAFDYCSITVIGGVFHAHVTRAACIWPSVVASSPFKFDDFTTISPRLIEGIETRRRNGTAVRAPCTVHRARANYRKESTSCRLSFGVCVEGNVEGSGSNIIVRV